MFLKCAKKQTLQEQGNRSMHWACEQDSTVEESELFDSKALDATFAFCCSQGYVALRGL